MNRFCSYRMRILYAIIFALFVTGANAKAEDIEDPKSQIGSIDDSGRVDADTFDFSNTEYKLWLDKHLLNIEQPARLHYIFTRSGSHEEGFSDDVYLDIKPNQNGSRDTVLDFFSAQRKQHVSVDNLRNVTGNPVIGAYMQGDTYEMQRLTSGHWKYFLRQIKLAMADTNESEAINIEFNGKKYASEKITLSPFESIENRSRLGKFADKTYQFTFSDDLPGKLYSIKTIIKDTENPTGEPLIVEELALQSVTFSP